MVESLSCPVTGENSGEQSPGATRPSHPVSSDNFSTMDDDTLAAAVSTLAAHIHAATYRLLVLIAELDRREVWAAQGALSCAHWLSWACGIDTHTAREKVRVARALTGAAAALRGAGEGRARLLQGPGADSHRHFGERGRPPQHRTARHCAACGEVRAPPSPGEARRRDRAGRCPAREPRPHLLARGRRHRRAARAVPARDGCAHPERARCGDGGARGGAGGGGVGRRRFGAGGRPSWDVRTGDTSSADARPEAGASRNRQPLPTADKTPKCS